MPMELLREIAVNDLPFTVSSESGIDNLRVLVAAGMVRADLPEPGAEGSAVVYEITGFGRATLKARSKDVKGGTPPLTKPD